MSVRFKFRSSVNFDTIEIDGGRPYISVAELRSKILSQKKLNISHKDFDLVFFDDLTGQEYNDDRFEIPSGSNVIVKRVPAEPVPSAVIRHQKLEESEHSENIPKVLDHNRPQEVVLGNKPDPESNNYMKLEKVGSSTYIDLQSAGLPSELRCPLCNTYFKEAVMIPCCQHSFCEKCIREVLVGTARCPKCSSTKIRVEHLLPNICLRRAIEHFLESQILATTPENNLKKYVPDGESGIQGKEVSCAIPETKRNMDLLDSASEEKVSNQNLAASAIQSPNRKNAFWEGSGYHTGNSNAISLLKSTPLLKVKLSDGNRDRPEDLAPVAGSHCKNNPHYMPQAHMLDEANPINRHRGLWVDPGGTDQGFAVGNKDKKAYRTCYMCGSPDHLIRDCPIASTQRSMFHTGDPTFHGGMPGYAMPYWNGAALPPINPYMMNMYGRPGMVPFNATMAPATPYGVPHYVPSMYGSIPVPSGMTRMEGLTPPVGTRAEQPFMHRENLEVQDNNRRKLLDEKREYPFLYEDDGCQKRHCYDELERSVGHKSLREKRKTRTDSEESHGQKFHKEHHHDKHLDQYIHSVERYGKYSHTTNSGRERRSYHTDRSVSGVDDLHNSNDRYDESRHKQYHRSPRRHYENREQSRSDSSWNRHQIRRERDVKRTVVSDVGEFQRKHNSNISSGLEPSSSGDQKKQSKGINHGHGFRESSERMKLSADEFHEDRCQVVSGSDEECIEGYHVNKRKRVHYNKNQEFVQGKHVNESAPCLLK